jgi:hypothetical protein
VPEQVQGEGRKATQGNHNFMTEPRPSGCGFLIVILVAMLTIFGISLPAMVTDGMHFLMPRPVAAIVLPQKDQTPFTLQNDQVIYSWRYTLDKPCNRVIQGRIHDTDGNPVTDVLVNIQMISPDGLPDASIHFHPQDFPYTYDDPSSWISLLVNWTVSYEVWLSDITGKPLSPTIWVNPQDCAHNVANLIFTQTGVTS